MLAVMEQRRYFALSLPSIYVFLYCFFCSVRAKSGSRRKTSHYQYLIDRTNKKLLRDQSFSILRIKTKYIFYAVKDRINITIQSSIFTYMYIKMEEICLCVQS